MIDSTTAPAGDATGDPTAPARPHFEPPAGPYTEWSAADLEAAVRYYDHVYWVEDRTEVADERYDRYVGRLKALRPDSPVLAKIGPARAAAELGALGETVLHAAPMLSLDKAYTAEELDRWAQTFEGTVVVSPKVDGVAASLRYGPDGALLVAATRGDGERGEDFTANARLVADIPGRLPLAAPSDATPGDPGVEVRGEVYMRLSVFARHAGEAANPRNLTAGTIKRKQASRRQLDDLSFFAYDLLGPDLPTESEKMRRLEALGFRTVEPLEVTKAEMQATFERWLGRRGELDYETDGVVFKSNDVAEQRRLGATAHHPRYALAYKFQGDSGESVLRAVEWSVARTGAVTPVAIIDPVPLSGATVSRCSLHNLNVLRRLALNVGDTVTATRRGGVIPHIEASLGGGETAVVPPPLCPSCDAPTAIDEDTLFCSAPRECRGVQRRALEHFVKALDIEGLGEKMLAQLFEAELVRAPSDFFALTESDFLRLDLVGEVLAAKLVASIRGAKVMSLERFLLALGIDGVGSQTAKALTAEFGSLPAIRSASEQALGRTTGVGDKLARGIREGLERLAQLVDDLEREIDLEARAAEASTPPVGPFAGLSVVFTGKLATMGRKEAQEEVRRAGGDTPPGVTKDLDILVIGDEGSALLGGGQKSTKHQKAEAYNSEGSRIEIISESEFRSRLRGAAPPEPAPPEPAPPEPAPREPALATPTQGTLL